MSTQSQAYLEEIQAIPLEALCPHPENPFGIRDAPAMQELAQSIPAVWSA